MARRQALDAGLAPHDVRRLLRRREWVLVHPGVYISHTGAPTWPQRAWAAVLALEPAALSHESVLRPGTGPIHVAIDRSRTQQAPPGVVRHYMADLEGRVHWNAAPPRVRIEHAVVDVATTARDDFAAIAALADAVQSRRTTAARIGAALEARGKVRRRAFLAAVIADVGAGTCSVLEHGYLHRVERAHGLPVAGRQVRASSRGPIMRDVIYRRYGQAVELDGRLFHDSARGRDRDLDRDLDAAIEGLASVRLGWGQVFDRPCRTAARVGRLLQRGGWVGAPTGCPECAVLPQFGATG